MRITIADVQRVVAKRYGIDMRSFLSRDKRREIAYPRQMAMTLAREVTGKSYPQIGHTFRRDHTTVMWAIWKVRDREVRSPTVACEMQALRAQLGVVPRV